MFNKIKGSIFGLAIGDSLGAVVENKTREFVRICPVSDLMPSKSHQTKRGEFTDDTSMMLCLAESLLEKAGFDATDQIEKYIKWKNEGYMGCQNRCIGIGGTTAYSLDEYEYHNNPLGAENNPNRAGNGSIMRLAPIAIYFRNSLIDVIKYSKLSSKVTHGANLCVLCCELFGVILYKVLLGETNKDNILNNQFIVSNSLEMQPLYKASFINKSIDEIKANAYVINSLEAALWCFYYTTNYKDAVLKAVSLGDDTDTTAAIVGQLAGAYYGFDSIPSEWVDAIAMKDILENTSKMLFEFPYPNC